MPHAGSLRRDTRPVAEAAESNAQGGGPGGDRPLPMGLLRTAVAAVSRSTILRMLRAYLVRQS